MCCVTADDLDDDKICDWQSLADLMYSNNNSYVYV